MEGIHTVAVHGGLSPVEDRGKMSGVQALRWKKLQSQRVMNWPQSHSPSPCATVGEEVKKKRREYQEEGTVGGALRFGFPSHYSTLICLVMN